MLQIKNLDAGWNKSLKGAVVCRRIPHDKNHDAVAQSARLKNRLNKGVAAIAGQNCQNLPPLDARDGITEGVPDTPAVSEFEPRKLLVDKRKLI